MDPAGVQGTMIKRTPDSSNPASDAPKIRTRAAKPAAARTRRKASAPAGATIASEAAAPAVVEAPGAVAVMERTEVVVATRTPSHDEIARRAYFIAIEQGADPLAAWLAAERELTTV
jgi:hypothetical protein